MGHGEHENGIHAYLYTENYCTDLTAQGIGFYEASDPWDFEDNRTIYLFTYPYAPLVVERATVLAQANVRLDTLDLWRCALEMMPVGLVCTTYALALLDIPVTCYKPEEVLELVQFHFPGGLLWQRNKIDQWQLKTNLTS